ncbi:MAG: MerR family transcriptional regulator [Actinomycetota bacterium]
MSRTELRVEELAKKAKVSVDTIRYYQHRGLLDPPQRSGRVANYSQAHLTRLMRIKELKDQGLSLSTIQRVLDGLHPADAALVSAVAGTQDAALTLEEVAGRAGVPPPLLQSIVAEGLLVPRNPDAERPYTESDVQALRAGMKLLEAGVPLSDLLSLGRRYTGAVNEIAEEAVALFDEYVRQPARSKEKPAQAKEHVVEAFNELLPAASALVRHNFERAILRAAQERIDRATGDDDPS